MMFIRILSLLAALGAVAGDFNSVILEQHNQCRKQEGADLPDLTQDNSLIAAAQAWANGCDWKHNDGRPQGSGENIYMSGPGTADQKEDVAKAAVQSWYSEKADYNFETKSSQNGKATGHYTQIVWKDTTGVGCAYALCDGNEGTWNYVVCNYKPGGNYVGENPYEPTGNGGTTNTNNNNNNDNKNGNTNTDATDSQPENQGSDTGDNTGAATGGADNDKGDKKQPCPNCKDGTCPACQKGTKPSKLGKTLGKFARKLSSTINKMTALIKKMINSSSSSGKNGKKLLNHVNKVISTLNGFIKAIKTIRGN